ncbi:MAG: hypothetical protein U1E60_00325 [Reyranellaceae bacterium]
MVTDFDLLCEQGTDLSFTVTYRRGETDIPVDLTGGFARMQARASMNASAPFLDVDSGSKGGIAVGGANGQITIFVPANVTDAFLPTREAVYDLEFVDNSGRTSRVLKGRFRVARQVTR